uniref:E3 ubiquitin-protein ligase CHIP n=1 Tax=Parastrongyloides trichosuri TaxID=131310 RepID=A0A0N4Z8N3_PARTI
MSATALELKAKGNRLYLQGKYEDALNYYSKAIIHDSTVPAFFTNRALCYMHLKKFDKVVEDCRKTLDMDSKNIKATTMLGRACLNQGQYDEAIKYLTIANEYCRESGLTYGDEIYSSLRQAKRAKFRQEEEKRIGQEIELQSYLNKLIKEDIVRRTEAILKSVDIENGSEEVDKINEKIEDLQLEGDDHMAQLNNLFSQVDERRKKRDIPDHLCGKISFELLTDPVITPSGITYNRSDIKEHLQKVGHFDPVTRAKLTEDMLIPNLAMKEVIDYFLSENEWAIDA